MTIEEKAMQLSAVMPFALLDLEGPIRSMLDPQLKQGIGHVSGLGLFDHKTPTRSRGRSTPSSATWSPRPA
jgi:beta-xylosidase